MGPLARRMFHVEHHPGTTTARPSPASAAKGLAGRFVGHVAKEAQYAAGNLISALEFEAWGSFRSTAKTPHRASVAEQR